MIIWKMQIFGYFLIWTSHNRPTEIPWWIEKFTYSQHIQLFILANIFCHWESSSPESWNLEIKVVLVPLYLFLSQMWYQLAINTTFGVTLIAELLARYIFYPSNFLYLCPMQLRKNYIRFLIMRSARCAFVFYPTQRYLNYTLYMKLTT